MHHRGIVFDFFGVICSEVAPYWLERHFAPTEAASIKEELVGAADRGAVSQAALFQELARLSGSSPAQIEHEWFGLARIDEKVVAVIRSLAGRSRLGLLTNAPAPFFRTLLARAQIESLFDSIVVSSEQGFAKPDPRAYRVVLSELQLNPANALMVDDNPANVAGAVAVGMETILFRSSDQLEFLADRA